MGEELGSHVARKTGSLGFGLFDGMFTQNQGENMTQYEGTWEGQIVIADALEVLPRINDKDVGLAFMDPPYENYELIMATLSFVLDWGCAVVCFGYPENICWYRDARRRPDQIVHWVKPVSTKNTSKRYSRFVEAIAIWHGPFFNQKLHWSCRTGVFTDTIVHSGQHAHRKPESLVKKLVLLHCEPRKAVIDIFSGSKVVRQVCKDYGIRSLSIDIKY